VAVLRRQHNLDYLATDHLDPPFGAIQLDLTAIDSWADSADFVICSRVLKHIRGAMVEVRRILRPGGQALIMVPVDVGRERTSETHRSARPVGGAKPLTKRTASGFTTLIRATTRGADFTLESQSGESIPGSDHGANGAAETRRGGVYACA